MTTDTELQADVCPNCRFKDVVTRTWGSGDRTSTCLRCDYRWEVRDNRRCDYPGCNQPGLKLVANDAPVLSEEYRERLVCQWHLTNPFPEGSGSNDE